MNHVAFEKLSREKKCRYVWTRCTFLASRFYQEQSQHKRFRINLFYNGRFFIEVWYNSECGYFGDIKSFTDAKLLEPYMDAIDIEAIITDDPSTI